MSLQEDISLVMQGITPLIESKPSGWGSIGELITGRWRRRKARFWNALFSSLEQYGSGAMRPEHEYVRHVNELAALFGIQLPFRAASALRILVRRGDARFAPAVLLTAPSADKSCDVYGPMPPFVEQDLNDAYSAVLSLGEREAANALLALEAHISHMSPLCAMGLKDFAARVAHTQTLDEELCARIHGFYRDFAAASSGPGTVFATMS